MDARKEVLERLEKAYHEMEVLVDMVRATPFGGKTMGVIIEMSDLLGYFKNTSGWEERVDVLAGLTDDGERR